MREARGGMQCSFAPVFVSLFFLSFFLSPCFVSSHRTARRKEGRLEYTETRRVRVSLRLG